MLGLTGLNKNFQKNRQSDDTNVVSGQSDDASNTIKGIFFFDNLKIFLSKLLPKLH